MTRQVVDSELAETIKERLRRGDQTHREIAEDLGISTSAVSRVARVSGLGKGQQRRLSGPPRTQERMRRIRPNLEWQERAACEGMSYFTEPGNVAQKKLVCRGCEVRRECLQFSFGEELFDGMVYGGLEAKEIVRLKKQARAARAS
jgi:predicted transcriptional regulator